ncbi:velvet factor-domain-containing protein [Mycena pura]|uniref:Velvet factor-domain-containing protein n=1 Tax=Mycena pura TaxID=153505 RepID=A0AAD6VJ21_9AGAR|nr:velvet factor-domain-containing protein [Mycena pura]
MASDCAFLRYDVTIRQQPLHARISAMKISADRRPVDPPIIVQLCVTDLRDTGSASLSSPTANKTSTTRHSHLTNPYYFMYAALVTTSGDIDVKHDGGKPSTSGALVSSVRVLKDYPNSDQDAAFFIFPDICVRLEGSWRFKLSLFVVDCDRVKLCAVTFSEPFFVYRGKLYPGVQVSTPLTRALAAQGVKLRIRKEVREKAGTVRPKDESPVPKPREDPRVISSGLDASHFFERSPPKRRRTLMSPFGGTLSGSESSVGSLSNSPTDISNIRIPLPPSQVVSPSPAVFGTLTKSPEYDRHPLRRASLGAPILARRQPSRDWNVTSAERPRLLDAEQLNFLLSVPIPGKPDPEYPQWGLLRPAHPYPEAAGYTVSRPGAYSALFNTHGSLSSPVESECERSGSASVAATAFPVYSWSSAAPSREALSPLGPGPEHTQDQHHDFSSPAAAFWQESTTTAPRAAYEPHVHVQRSGWAVQGRPDYGGPTLAHSC